MLISTEGAAAYLGVSPRRIRQFVADGRLPAHRIDGRTYAFLRTDLKRIRYRPHGRPRRRPALAVPDLAASA